jgi:hypothetical protein
VLSATTVLSTLNEYLETPFIKSIMNSKANKNNNKGEEDEQSSDTKNYVKSHETFLSKFLTCFSLKQNVQKLWNVTNDDEIKCLHGLKAISIVLLFISLKLIPMGRVPYTNRNKFTEFFNSPLSVFLRSSFLYEDVFLVVSGFLASINVINDIKAGDQIVWFKKIIGRFLRLMLPLAVVLLFYAFVFEHIATGPQWNIVTKNAELCQDNMWKNLMFIQNFYNFEDMVNFNFIINYNLVITKINFSVPLTHITWPSTCNCSSLCRSSFG